MVQESSERLERLKRFEQFYALKFCSARLGLAASFTNKKARIPTDELIRLIENRAPVLSPTRARTDPLPQRGDNFQVPFCPTYSEWINEKTRKKFALDLFSPA